MSMTVLLVTLSLCGVFVGTWIWRRQAGAKVPRETAEAPGEIVTVVQPDLLSAVSHELRTPLTSIRGALDLVSSGVMGNVPDDIGDLVRIARENSDRLMNLVNDLLDLRKIESGRFDLKVEPVRLRDLVHEVAQVMEPIAWAHGVSLDWCAVDSEVFLDRTRCTQVLLNVVHNAVRHSPRKGIVSIEATYDRDRLHIVVDDEGPGVPADLREKIFEPFARVGESNPCAGPSSGLGLSISQGIVTSHGGEIKVERAPRGGARFVISLPGDCRRRLAATAS